MTTNVIPIDRDRMRDDVKRTLVDPLAVCAALGLEEGAKRQAGGLSVRCPAHNENNPSCSVTRGNEGGIRVRCFACGFSGDVFNLVAAVRGLDVRRDFPRVLEEAARLAGIDAPRPVTVAAPKPTVDYQAAWEALEPLDADGWEYLRDRGLEAVADMCKSVGAHAPGDLGWMGRNGYRLALPLRDASGCVTAIQARKLTSHEFRIAGRSGDGVFGDPARVGIADLVVLAEGLSDTLAATLATGADSNIAVVGIAGTAATAALFTLPLAGKRVLVATDADGPGDAAAVDLEPRLIAAGATPIRCRPTQGKDLCDMLGKGVDLAQFFRNAARATGFVSVAERIRTEREERLQWFGKTLKYGVHFLDVALGGIYPRDLVLIGAKTGRGKTALATLIAQANVLAGKRVHYFALEAEDKEIERRMKYNLLAERVYQRPVEDDTIRDRMNFLDWYAGKLDAVTAPYEKAIDGVIGQAFENLYTFYRVKDFTVDDLDRALKSLSNDTDLAIVDHVHFLDHDDKDENRGYKRIVKKIREAVLSLNKPIVVIAHVRKSERKSSQIVPIIEDFHGTSDLPKMVTAAVMIGPAFEEKRELPYLWPTYINPVKYRRDGERARYCAIVAFNSRMNVYEKDFALGMTSPNGDKFTFVGDDERPRWAQEYR